MKTNNEKHIKNLYEINDWSLITNKLHFQKDDFLICESLTSLGNGYFGSRGNFEETYTGNTHPGVYNAGVWFPDATRVGWWKNGYPLYFGKAINSLNFLKIKVFINDIELDLFKLKPIKYRQELNLKTGILSRDFEVIINDINLNCHTERFYSIADNETAFIKYEITPKNDCVIRYESILDGDVINFDSNYNEKFWESIDYFANKEEMYLSIKTKNNSYNVDRFSVFGIVKNICDGELIHCKFEPFLTSQMFKKEVKKNQLFSLIKKIVILSTRHHLEKNIKKDGILKIKKIIAIDYEKHKQNNIDAWSNRWKIADIQIIGDDKAQQGIRFSLFQLFSTYYGEDANFNIGPKGFTGEKYGGATYWDTEAYCLPVYLALCDPKIARNLLMYRYKQLKPAIFNAQKQGLEGALYPMVTFNGYECHNEWEITFEEIHRNGIVAFAIYNYTNYTNDEEYIKKYGLSVLVEIARFFASRVHYSDNKKMYMMHGVTGPNEFENNVNNNWYTNYLAKWVLEYTLKNLTKFKIDLKKYKLINKDINKWKAIIKKMYLGYDNQKNIFIQNDNFLDKEFIEVKNLSINERPIVQNWSWDKILRSCYIKQADVLQGIYLFYEQFNHEEILSNYNFYTKYTVHESSLSPCIHSVLAAKLNKLEDSYYFYSRSARLDLDNYNNDTKDGLHITSMAGSWMSIVEGFGGMKVIKGQLTFTPKLPKKWKGLIFNILFKKSLIKIEILKETTKLTLIKGNAQKIIVNNKALLLKEALLIKNR